MRASGRGNAVRRSRLVHTALLASTALTAISLIVAVPQAALAQTWQLGGVDNTNYNETTNWDTNTVPGQGNANSGIFAAAGSTTVAVNTAVTPGGWAFTTNAQSYSITGSNVTFSGTGIVNNANANQSIDNNIGGTAGVTQNGGGTLVLSGSNSYTGGTTISAGTLTVMNGSALDDGSRVTVNGGTFNIATSEAIGSLAGAAGSSVTIDNNQVLSTGGDNSSTTFAGTFSGAGSLEFLGNGTKTLTGFGSSIDGNLTNNSTGAVTIDGGSLAVGGQTFIAQGALTLSNGGTLTSDIGNVGFGLGATATALVTGAGSIWTVTNGLSIGNASGPGGIGTLTVADGGAVVISDPNQVIAVDSGSTLNLGNGGLAGTVDTSQVTLNGTGQLVANFTDTSTLAANIQGDGSVTKQGTGTLILTGDSGYTGGTTISGGVLQLGNGGTTGSIGGDITNNSILAINRAAGTTLTLDGIISGSGGVQQNGPGTTMLTGNNTYGGGTTFNVGTLSVEADTNLGAANGALTFNGGVLQFTNFGAMSLSASRAITLNAGGGTFDMQGFGEVTISQAIGGAGGLNQTGFGILILSGTNTYGGATTVNDNGLLVVDNGNAVPNGSAVTLNDSAALELDASETIGSLASSSSTTQVVGSIFGIPVTLTTGGNNASTTFAGVISDGCFCATIALTKVGDGTFTLSGDNTYTGATTIEDGALYVTGSIANSAVTVAEGALLGGTGTVGGTTVNGMLSPGLSIGTINVSGNLAFSSAASYLVEVSPTDADRTNVTGTASLAGGLELFPSAGTYTIGRQYTLLHADGGISGTFTTGDISGLFGRAINARIAYDFDDVFLILDPNTISQFLPSTAGGNQRSVANAVNQVLVSGSAPPAFLNLFGLTEEGLNSAMSQLSGEANAGAQGAAMQLMNQYLALLSQYRGTNGAGSGAASGFVPERQLSPEATAAYAAVTPKDKRAAFDPRWSLWGSGFGGHNKTGGDAAAGSHDTTARSYGFAGGADYRLTPDTVAGFALAGAGAAWGLSSGLGGGESDAFLIGGYATRHIGPTYLSAALSYAWHSMRTDRQVTIAGTDRLRGEFDASSFGGRLEGGYRVATPYLGVTPYGAVQVQTFHAPSYSESVVSGSSAFALTYGSRDVVATRTELGAGFDKTITLDQGFALTLRSRAAWVHDFNPDSRFNAAFQVLPAATFTIDGAQAPANLALVSAAAELQLSKSWSASAKFDGEFASSSQTYAGTGTIKYVW